MFESDGVQVRGKSVENCGAGLAVGSGGWLLPTAENTKIQRNTVEDALFGIVLPAVAFDGHSSTNPSASSSKVVRNDLAGGSIGEVGIRVIGYEGDPEFDTLADNNQVIRNAVSGLSVAILDAATDSLVHANTPVLRLRESGG